MATESAHALTSFPCFEDQCLRNLLSIYSLKQTSAEADLTCEFEEIKVTTAQSSLLILHRSCGGHAIRRRQTLCSLKKGKWTPNAPTIPGVNLDEVLSRGIHIETKNFPEDDKKSGFKLFVCVVLRQYLRNLTLILFVACYCGYLQRFRSKFL